MSKKKQNIVIIDDDPDFLEIFSTKLRFSDFEVYTANRGKTGIELIKKVKPDLVLLDVEMPELNGIETMSRIKKDDDIKDIAVSFLTNYGEPQKEATWLDEKFAREAGAMDYIKKSDDLGKIVDEVKKIIKGSNSDESDL